MTTIRRVIGAMLVSLSVLTIVQSARELLLWRNQDAYVEKDFLPLPIVFGGHRFTVRDDQLSDSVSHEQAYEGQAQWMRDGAAMGAPARALVRRGRSDIGRYHLWISAWVFVDKATHDTTLMLTRRLEPTRARSVAYEVTTVRANGAMSTAQYSAWQLGQSYPLFRSTQFLHDGGSSEGMPYSALGLASFPLLFVVYPFGSLVVGCLMLRRQGRNR